MTNPPVYQILIKQSHLVRAQIHYPCSDDKQEEQDEEIARLCFLYHTIGYFLYHTIRKKIQHAHSIVQKNIYA